MKSCVTFGPQTTPKHWRSQRSMMDHRCIVWTVNEYLTKECSVYFFNTKDNKSTADYTSARLVVPHCETLTSGPFCTVETPQQGGHRRGQTGDIHRTDCMHFNVLGDRCCNVLQCNVERDICVKVHDDGNVDRVVITKEHVHTNTGTIKCIKVL